MIGGLVAVLLIVVVGGRAIDDLRRREAENILARLEPTEARAYYEVLRRRMRRIVLMRALAILSLLWIFVVVRQRLARHEAPSDRTTSALEARPAASRIAAGLFDQRR